MKKVRSQADENGDAISKATAIDFSDAKDMTRQEFKDDADINILLKRFGLNQQLRQMTFTEVNYDLDLQQAFAAIKEARAIASTVPDELREKYPNWRAVLNATETGQYQQDLAIHHQKERESNEAHEDLTEFRRKQRRDNLAKKHATEERIRREMDRPETEKEVINKP